MPDLLEKMEANRVVIEGFLGGYDQRRARALHRSFPPEEVKTYLLIMLGFKANVLMAAAKYADKTIADLPL